MKGKYGVNIVFYRQKLNLHRNKDDVYSKYTYYAFYIENVYHKCAKIKNDR